MDVDFASTPPRRQPLPASLPVDRRGGDAGAMGTAGSLRAGPLFAAEAGPSSTAAFTTPPRRTTATTTTTTPARSSPHPSLLLLSPSASGSAAPVTLGSALRRGARFQPPPSDRHVPRSLFGRGGVSAAAASPFDAALALDDGGGGARRAAAGATSAAASSLGGRNLGGVVGTSGAATAAAAAAAEANNNNANGNARPSSAGAQAGSAYSALLRSQLLGAAPAQTPTASAAAVAGAAATRTTTPARGNNGSDTPSAATPSGARPRILSYNAHGADPDFFASPARGARRGLLFGAGGTSLDPEATFDADDDFLHENALSSPLLQRRRRVPRAPFKILDAPALADDFYLNLVDWSSQNVLAVGLGPCVYLWSAATSSVTKLCDLSDDDEVSHASSALARFYQATQGGNSSAVPQIQPGVGDAVCSVSWSQRGNYLAVGTGAGVVQVFDVCRAGEGGSGRTGSSSSARLRTYVGHRGRVSSLSWGAATLSTGSRDRTVAQRDVRCPEQLHARLCGHRSEVCGLRASPEGRMLASGGNDNALLVWDVRRLHGGGGGVGGGGSSGSASRREHRLQRQRDRASSTSNPSSSSAAAAAAAAAEAAEDHPYPRDEASIFTASTPLYRFTEHTAAVKALAWSPHAHGLLASGGGTADRCIRFWSTNGSGGGGGGTETTATAAQTQSSNSANNNEACLGAIDTGSQVCNLAWARHANELVSTHGYSQNAVALWRYPTMSRVATLTGHTTRVLYLAASPDGRSIVTGAGDETLRFWSVFPGPNSTGGRGRRGGIRGREGEEFCRSGFACGGGASSASAGASPSGNNKNGSGAASTPLSGLSRSWLR